MSCRGIFKFSKKCDAGGQINSSCQGCNLLSVEQIIKQGHVFVGILTFTSMINTTSERLKDLSVF